MAMKWAGKKATVFLMVFFFLVSFSAIPPTSADFSVNQTPETSAGVPVQGSGSGGGDSSLPAALSTGILTTMPTSGLPGESREEQPGPPHMNVPARTPLDPMTVPFSQLVWSQSMMRWVLPPLIFLTILAAVAYYYYRRE